MVYKNSNELDINQNLINSNFAFLLISCFGFLSTISVLIKENLKNSHNYIKYISLISSFLPILICLGLLIGYNAKYIKDIGIINNSEVIFSIFITIITLLVIFLVKLDFKYHTAIQIIYIIIYVLVLIFGWILYYSPKSDNEQEINDDLDKSTKSFLILSSIGIIIPLFISFSNYTDKGGHTYNSFVTIDLLNDTDGFIKKILLFGLIIFIICIGLLLTYKIEIKDKNEDSILHSDYLIIFVILFISIIIQGGAHYKFYKSDNNKTAYLISVLLFIIILIFGWLFYLTKLNDSNENDNQEIKYSILFFLILSSISFYLPFIFNILPYEYILITSFIFLFIYLIISLFYILGIRSKESEHNNQENVKEKNIDTSINIEIYFGLSIFFIVSMIALSISHFKFRKKDLKDKPKTIIASLIIYLTIIIFGWLLVSEGHIRLV